MSGAVICKHRWRTFGVGFNTDFIGIALTSGTGFGVGFNTDFIGIALTGTGFGVGFNTDFFDITLTGTGFGIVLDFSPGGGGREAGALGGGGGVLGGGGGRIAGALGPAIVLAFGAMAFVSLLQAEWGESHPRKCLLERSVSDWNQINI